MPHHEEDVVALRRQGFRLTLQRRLMLEVLQANGAHLSAEQIHAQVIARLPNVNVATVYRNLQWLHDMGVVHKIDIGCGRLLWEYADAEPHHHLICQRCGQVQEIDNHVMDCFSVHVRDHYDFDVNLDHLAIFGRCAACRGLANDPAAA